MKNQSQNSNDAKTFSDSDDYRALLESISHGVEEIDASGRITFANSALHKMYECDAGELIGELIFDYVAEDSEREELRDHLRYLVKAQPAPVPYFGKKRTKSGRIIDVEVVWNYRRDTQGRLRGFTAIVSDITQRKHAEAELRLSEARLKEAQRVGRIGSWERNMDTGEGWWSDELIRLFGEDPRTFDLAYANVLEKIHPEDRLRVKKAMEATWNGGEPYMMEFEVVLPDGTQKTIRSRAELKTDERGRPLSIAGTAQDITEWRKLEEQLHQAQKMEAVGQLTGGIAHDFNNLLAVIIGNLQLIEDSSKQDGSLHAMVQAGLDAGYRGAELTKRLLAFSRQQQLTPEAVDINQLVTEIESLLKTTLGEEIILKTRLGEGLWLTEIDSSQMESSLVNLAVNAKDAMRGGGTLTIETTNISLGEANVGNHANVPPGEYVQVTVGDTGTGIPEDVLANVFEPFFSTKDVGEGSGLGLSMVYGFVTQSEGYIDIHSEEGHGTIFKVYLPRFDAAVETTRTRPTRNKGIPTGEETILVVEDDAAVRQMAGMLLESFGYRVIEASDGSEAVDLLATYDDVDLLFTDVVMPGGMNGAELAVRALQRNPNMKVLYTSGHAAIDILDEEWMQPDQRMLNKPYRKEELARAIREVLDGE